GIEGKIGFVNELFQLGRGGAAREGSPDADREDRSSVAALLVAMRQCRNGLAQVLGHGRNFRTRSQRRHHDEFLAAETPDRCAIGKGGALQRLGNLYQALVAALVDRKSTRLNSSHV